MYKLDLEKAEELEIIRWGRIIQHVHFEANHLDFFGYW